MLAHEVKHANVKHIAKIKLQFMVPILEILLLIQLQGGNNLADLTPEVVWVEKLRTFLSKHGFVQFHHYLEFSIGLPYHSYVFRVFQ